MTNDKIKRLNNFFAAGKSLGELLNETIELRNLDVKKLSELSDIPVHCLTALINGEFSKLPAAPYIRGYLIKIAGILRIDRDTVLRAYKQEISLRPLKVSGPEDKLPSNRYALKPIHRRTLFIIGIILVIVIAFLMWQIEGFWGTPKIEITNPAVNNLAVGGLSIKLTGRVNPRDKLTINAEEILVAGDGLFEKDFFLQPGINTIEFKVKRFLGKETKTIRQVIYQPQ